MIKHTTGPLLPSPCSRKDYFTSNTAEFKRSLASMYWVFFQTQSQCLQHVVWIKIVQWHNTRSKIEYVIFKSIQRPMPQCGCYWKPELHSQSGFGSLTRLRSKISKLRRQKSIETREIRHFGKPFAFRNVCIPLATNVNPWLIKPGWLLVVVPPNNSAKGYWNGISPKITA